MAQKKNPKGTELQDSQKGVRKKGTASENRKRSGSLGIDPDKGINGKLINEDYSTVGKPKNLRQKRRTSGNRQNANVDDTKIDDSKIKQLFAPPQKVAGPSKKVESRFSKTSGKGQAKSTENEDVDLNVAELAKLYESDPASLKDKPIYIRGVVRKSGVEKINENFVPAISLGIKDDHSNNPSDAPSSPLQLCVFDHISNLLLCELDGEITLRGKLAPTSRTLIQCKIIAISGNKIPTLSAPSLAAYFKKDPQTFRQTLEGKQVLLKGNVEQLTSRHTVADHKTPMVVKGIEGVAIGIHSSLEKKNQQFHDIKIGQEIVVIGRAVFAKQTGSDGSPKIAIVEASRADILLK